MLGLPQSWSGQRPNASNGRLRQVRTAGRWDYREIAVLRCPRLSAALHRRLGIDLAHNSEVMMRIAAALLLTLGASLAAAEIPVEYNPLVVVAPFQLF